MKCAHIRRILAVSPREWTAAQRQQVEEHTRACADCARLARDFAAQERALSALPQTRMSPGRQRAVLAQTRHEADWLRLRVRLSNALTAAAGILALAFLIAAVVTLLPTPPPPATIVRAPFRLTLRRSRCRLSSRTERSNSLNFTFSSIISPRRCGSPSPRRMTPSRTVAICGQRRGLTMVAIMLPPKAGRICSSRFL